MDDIKELTEQRNSLAQYIYKNGGTELYANYCVQEMETGRCPFKDRPYDTSRTIDACVPCIVNLLGNGAYTPPTPFFYLLSKYHILVMYIDVRGAKETGRVQSVENETIVIEVRGKLKRYYLQDIDVIIPKEVLRWSHGGLSPVIWQAMEQVQQPIPQGDISACLLSIGVRPYMEGALELETAVHLVLEDPTLLNSMERLYLAVAVKIKMNAQTVASHILKLIGILKRDSQNTGNYYAFYSTLTGRLVSVKAFLRAFLVYTQLFPSPGLAPGTEKQLIEQRSCPYAGENRSGTGDCTASGR